ncbi:hypothetical protein PUNSTDRAFT_146593 [Punctularia strigosozonata HHB-11173 SS5]|uniref:CHAT domain-containing protein n=1 Tax=Punctularia strigosozonata (strain HHB-11173) TaxID=741275 RepID=R7S516_PUNST|nr:uncharacterized protein PUNSTDRAFT_146593 [Punctularia strigosozonata HHB-11173 SS5]EIN04386.1 hypothetical protein PUNSTDRAFT_146593 [Punctularia strigosozonata HHB-11173 SS5]
MSAPPILDNLAEHPGQTVSGHCDVHESEDHHSALSTPGPSRIVQPRVCHCALLEPLLGEDGSWRTAIGLHDVHEKEGDADALEDCIKIYRRLLDDGGAVQLHVSEQRAVTRRTLAFKLLQDRNGLAHASGRHCVLSRLSRALRQRFLFHGVQQDLQDAVAHGRSAVEACDSEGVSCPATTTTLADALRERFGRLSSAEDLDEASQLCQSALDGSPPGCKLRPGCLNAMGRLACYRFRLQGMAGGAAQAIVLHREALHTPGLAYPEDFKARFLLALALFTEYEVDGQMDKLEEAIKLYRTALELCPPKHVDRPIVLLNVGIALTIQGEDKSVVSDVQEAITHLRNSLSLRPPGDPYRINSMSTLGNAVRSRFILEGRPEDLQEATQIRRDVIACCPPENPHMWIFVGNLANVLGSQYEHFGSLGDLDECIQLQREAMRRIPSGHPRIAIVLCNLAECLIMRFDDTGRGADLEEAIQSFREASDITRPGHPHYSNTVEYLATCLRRRFRISGAYNDLEDSIALSRRAIGMVSKSYSGYPPMIIHLAEGLWLRGEHRRDLDDIIHAIKALEDLDPDLTPEVERQRWFEILGKAYFAKFKHTRSASDFEKARELVEKQLELLTTGHRERSRRLIDLAELHLEHGPGRDIAQALQFLSEGLTDDHLDVRARLREGVRLLSAIECDHGDITDDVATYSRLLDVYRTIVHLLPRLAFFEVDLPSRLKTLAVGQSVAVTAASHALELSRPQDALEILEQSRAIFWTHSLRLRSQFDLVPDEYRRRLLELSRQLDRHDEGTGLAIEKQQLELARARRWKQTDEFHNLVGQVRSLPGLERFMLPDDLTALSGIARHGPVVVLIASKVTRRAVVLRRPGDIVNVPLPLVSVEGLVQSSKGWKSVLISEKRSVTRDSRLKLHKTRITGQERSATHVILEQLWVGVVKPVLDSLGLKPSQGRDRPRLWWCPTGEFARLPIHAASGGDETCSDYVVSSYIPTLGALATARASYTPLTKRQCKVLLAAVPRSHVPMWADLPSIVDEIQNVAEILPADSLMPIPDTEDARVGDGRGVHAQTLLDRLPEANILHLACHGMQDPENPLESGFVMRDGILNIARLMGTPSPNALMAFLSACETAKGDKNQPDQTIHLAATMLFAGFKSIIATLWSMEDVDGPMIASHIYKELFHGGSEHLDPDIIPYALDSAVRKLREVETSPSRWAPYIHLGM